MHPLGRVRILTHGSYTYIVSPHCEALHPSIHPSIRDITILVFEVHLFSVM